MDSRVKRRVDDDRMVKMLRDAAVRIIHDCPSDFRLISGHKDTGTLLEYMLQEGGVKSEDVRDQDAFDDFYDLRNSENEEDEREIRRLLENALEPWNPPLNPE